MNDPVPRPPTNSRRCFMQKFFAAMLSLITTALCFPQMRVQAAHTTPLFHATREYRDATQYLSRVLSNHANLAPPHQRFLNRLIHSSHQLYAAALAGPFNAAGTLSPEFRQTWSDIQALVKDLRWMIESLPPEAKQTLAPHCRRFISTFQTLAVQITLSKSVCAPYGRGGHAGLKRTKFPEQMVLPRATLTHSPQARPNHRSSERRAGREMLGVSLLSRQTLSPSEWQLHRAGIRIRTETPTQNENANTGARLTRLSRTR